MKLINLAVLFIIIVFPFIFISGTQTKLYHEDEKLRIYYDQVIDNAVQDAAFVWADFQKKSSYDTEYSLDNAREIAAKSLLDSLYYAFGVYGDKSGMARVRNSVPILLFLEQDGYTFYALTEYKNSEGYRVIDYCWYPIHPYVGEGVTDTYRIRYTLGDIVYIYDCSTNTESIGIYSDLSSIIPAFGSNQQFENLKTSAITKSIEKDLTGFMERFNSYSKNMGVTFEFHFPRMDESDWRRAIQDESILVFAQGLPVLTGKQYEIEAFGGARVMRKPTLAGYTRNGIKTYCKDSCTLYQVVSQDPAFDLNSLLFFSTAKEAASNGYYPCSECRP